MKLAKSGDGYFYSKNLDENSLDKSDIKLDGENENPYYRYSHIKMLKDNKYCTLFPTEEQIKKMNLKNGKNDICFVVEAYWGNTNHKIEHIFWTHRVKMILWNIDGTITRSDVLGALLPRLGFDWNHDGVIELIDKMSNNGYKIVYLTARTIFQGDATHEFLANLKKDDIKLSDGPIIIDPDGIFSSFKKGIVQKQQYLIKILSLLEIKTLFGKNVEENNFYAGFGNKETDAIAYRYLNIPMKNIFIIDTSSEIVQLGEKKNNLS